MASSTARDLVTEFGGDIIGAYTVGMAIQDQYGDKPLQDLIDAGVTNSDFWDFFKEVASRDISFIARLSNEGNLKSTAEAWKAKRH